MALTVGNTVASTTTIAQLVDQVFANKTAALTGASATYTALEAQRLVGVWSGTPNGDCLVHIVVVGRQLPPNVIAL